jgi:hypothetical protein
MATPAQKVAVVLAFLAAGLSLGSVASRLAHGDGIPLTPLVGGMLMLALGIGGVIRLRNPPKS